MAGIELQILNWIQALRNPVLDQIMVFITKLGDAGLLWILIALVFCVKKDTRKTGNLIFLSIMLEVIICNLLLKPCIQRIRPCDINPALKLLVERPGDFSFPSGHTGAAFACTASLFLMKDRLRYPVLILSILIAFSRMYLYVHYPTDILGGIITGIVSAMLAFTLYKHLTKTDINHFILPV